MLYLKNDANHIIRCKRYSNHVQLYLTFYHYIEHTHDTMIRKWFWVNLYRRQEDKPTMFVIPVPSPRLLPEISHKQLNYLPNALLTPLNCKHPIGRRNKEALAPPLAPPEFRPMAGVLNIPQHSHTPIFRPLLRSRKAPNTLIRVRASTDSADTAPVATNEGQGATFAPPPNFKPPEPKRFGVRPDKLFDVLSASLTLIFRLGTGVFVSGYTISLWFLYKWSFWFFFQVLSPVCVVPCLLVCSRGE